MRFFTERKYSDKARVSRGTTGGSGVAGLLTPSADDLVVLFSDPKVQAAIKPKPEDIVALINNPTVQAALKNAADTASNEASLNVEKKIKSLTVPVAIVSLLFGYWVGRRK